MRECKFTVAKRDEAEDSAADIFKVEGFVVHALNGAIGILRRNWTEVVGSLLWNFFRLRWGGNRFAGHFSKRQERMSGREIIKEILFRRSSTLIVVVVRKLLLSVSSSICFHADIRRAVEWLRAVIDDAGPEIGWSLNDTRIVVDAVVNAFLGRINSWAAGAYRGAWWLHPLTLLISTRIVPLNSRWRRQSCLLESNCTEMSLIQNNE